MRIASSQIIYSEHDYDECFEYKDGSGRVPDGTAIGYETIAGKVIPAKLALFDDIKYSQYDHDYWDNLELENDINRVII
tara:strand:- start:3687 stop:3923 length:237 start_codon:yes stop_codon:yes gene_type:complete